MRMQVILDSSFVRPGSAPIWGGKKGEFRDWTRLVLDTSTKWHPNRIVKREMINRSLLTERGWLRMEKIDRD